MSDETREEKPLRLALRAFSHTHAHTQTSAHRFAERYIGAFGEESHEQVRGLHLSPPHLDIVIPHLLGDDHEEEEDGDALEGHHDGVDVGQRQQLLAHDDEHPYDPGHAHDDHEGHDRQKPAPDVSCLHLSQVLPLLVPPHDDCGHDQEGCVCHQDDKDWGYEGPNEVGVGV